MDKETRKSFLEYALYGSRSLQYIPFSDKASFPFATELVQALEITTVRLPLAPLRL